MKALKINEKLLGEKHDSVSLLLRLIGLLYYKMGNLTKAEEFLMGFCNNNPDIALSLGFAYEKNGNFEKWKNFI